MLNFVDKVQDMANLRDSFLKLSANPQPLSQLSKLKDLCDVYLTQDSIINNFYKVFGYRNETLALRFYNILAEGYNGLRIYLPTYCIKLKGIVDGFPMQLNLFGFKLLDSEMQGVVYATDIADMV